VREIGEEEAPWSERGAVEVEVGVRVEESEGVRGTRGRGGRAARGGGD